MPFHEELVAAFIATGGAGTNHIEISSPTDPPAPGNSIKFFTGDATETSPALVWESEVFAGYPGIPVLYLKSPQTAALPNPAQLSLGAGSNTPANFSFVDIAADRIRAATAQFGTTSVAPIAGTAGSLVGAAGDITTQQLAIQAGTFVGNTGAGATVGQLVVAFPTSFATSVLCVLVSDGDNSVNSGQEIVSVDQAYTLAGFKAHFFNPFTAVYPSNLPRRVNWLAIGV